MCVLGGEAEGEGYGTNGRGMVIRVATAAHFFWRVCFTPRTGHDLDIPWILYPTVGIILHPTVRNILYPTVGKVLYPTFGKMCCVGSAQAQIRPRKEVLQSVDHADYAAPTRRHELMGSLPTRNIPAAKYLDDLNENRLPVCPKCVRLTRPRLSLPF